MPRSPDTRRQDAPSRQRDALQRLAEQEGDIDQILEDSFPASDAPPWTFGVPLTNRGDVREQKRQPD